MESFVVAVSKNAEHDFSKKNVESINLIENFGVEGDAHAGKHIKHIFLAKKDPTRKNIRQVHLIQLELLNRLNEKGFTVSSGDLGENITTQGVDLLGLPEGTRLHLGNEAIVELTALRNPCVQIENFQKGLLKEVVGKDDQGNIIRKLGVMGVVVKGGKVTTSDAIEVELPKLPHKELEYIW